MINHFYSGEGQWLFDQILYYEWNRELCRFDVIDFRLIKDGRAILTEKERIAVPPKEPRWIGSPMIPMKQTNGTYKAAWRDEGLLREVVCDAVYESWGQVDPELLERDILPKDERRELTNPNRLILENAD